MQSGVISVYVSFCYEVLMEEVINLILQFIEDVSNKEFLISKINSLISEKEQLNKMGDNFYLLVDNFIDNKDSDPILAKQLSNILLINKDSVIFKNHNFDTAKMSFISVMKKNDLLSKIEIENFTYNMILQTGMFQYDVLMHVVLNSIKDNKKIEIG